MKRLTIIILTLLITIVATAQDQRPAPQKFSPEKFQADLEQFITKEACLTSKEASQFFPVYKEMQAKLRAVFDQQRQLGKVKPGDEKGCEKAIRQRDEYDLELKRIQQTYHNKFLSVLSPSKVYDVLKAEDRFHRQMLRGWNHGRHNGTRQK
ncbi:MAG: hypothetical protein IKM76_05995 [Prevotella sp.]|nr:hypothetical protein [Prevotella sp.]